MSDVCKASDKDSHAGAHRGNVAMLAKSHVVSLLRTGEASMDGQAGVDWGEQPRVDATYESGACENMAADLHNIAYRTS